ncbi:MAG: hypothetical protein JJT77_01605 [Crocinitomicaceae bacterium]|nr:hypothetical protein [Crocinitomicaceae bacterium]
MTKFYIFLLYLLIVFCSFSQEDHFLSGNDKAYLFHTVRKSPILELNIGRYLDYRGPMIYLPNGEINYDSIELLIINEPALLKILSSEISKAPKGVLAEAANKQAVWELNKLLHAYRKNNLEKEGLSGAFNRFEEEILSQLPEVAIRRKDDKLEINPKLINIWNPSLAFNDRLAMLDGFGKWTIQERRQVIEAFNYATNAFVENRAKEIFLSLGGQADLFINVLVAAGDGSSTSGLFEEREKDERGRWNKGLPKAVGLFPYDTQIILDEKKKKNKEKIEPLRYAIRNFETFGEERVTKVHLDVWGYNSEKQTTVVIEKNGWSYPLFGSTESRFLSPDSSFTGKATYYTFINRVQLDINVLEEKISGKRGYDYQIQYTDKKRKDKLLQINKLEKELSDARMNPITTKDRKLKTESGKKYRKKSQEKLISYYNQLKALEKKIKTLKEEKQIAIDLQQEKEQQKSRMLDLIGRRWMPFWEKDGFFTFEDGATFDLLTQTFTFSQSAQSEQFEIRLIAIPYSHTSDQVDEVMLHINILDAKPFFNAKIQLNIIDQFASDKFELDGPLLTQNDSLAIRQFFEAMLDKNKPFKINAKGGGIGEMGKNGVIVALAQNEIANYPGSTKEERNNAKFSEEFQSLRTTGVFLLVDREIKWIVQSFTDPVKSNFLAPNKTIQEKAKQYKWTSNQLLSAYRTYAVMKQLQDELNIWAGKILTREEAVLVIDRLNKTIDKSSITIGNRSIKFKDFE